MHDILRPEAPTIVIMTQQDYELAVGRAKDLSEVGRDTSEYLELVALRAAMAQWTGQHQDQPPHPSGNGLGKGDR